MKLESRFALLNIKRGRKGLLKKLGGNRFGAEPGVRVPVVITGFITGAWGRDDGVSQEFEVNVTSAECGEPDRSDD